MASLSLRFTRLLSLALLACVPLALGAPAAAQPTDTAVKAAFVPRFARYVSWPPAAAPKGGNPYILCVIGPDPFGSSIDDAARSQLIDGRRIMIKRMGSAAGADGCHIAFISGGKGPSTGQLIAAFAGKPVLTVTDAANGPQRGMIHFTIVSGRVRFYIDQLSAAQRGIQISSRLLALAVGVRQ